MATFLAIFHDTNIKEDSNPFLLGFHHAVRSKGTHVRGLEKQGEYESTHTYRELREEDKALKTDINKRKDQFQKERG